MFERVPGLSSGNVNAILESHTRDRSGKPVIWVATYDQGAVRFADGNWRISGQAEGFSEARLFCHLERTDEKEVGKAPDGAF